MGEGLIKLDEISDRSAYRVSRFAPRKYFRGLHSIGFITANVTGVGDSFMWVRWDRLHWERRLSTQLLEKICLNPLTLDLLHAPLHLCLQQSRICCIFGVCIPQIA